MYEDVLAEFATHIVSSSKTESKGTNGSRIIKIKIVFKDDPRLHVFNRITELLQEEKYSYQWLRHDNSLIIRWDKEEHHHPEIDTSPFHKHIETNDNIQPSEPMTLQKVLRHITGLLCIFLLIGVGLYAWLLHQI